MNRSDSSSGNRFAISSVELRILWVVGLLVGFGFIMSWDLGYNSSTKVMGDEYYLTILKFVLTAVLGMVFAYLIRNADENNLEFLGYFLMIVSVGLLFWTLQFEPVNGAKRWITIFGYKFQPVEVFKFSMALGIASVFAKGTNIGKSLIASITCACIFWVSILISLFFIYLQPNHSANVICVLVGIMVVLMAKTNWRYVIGISLIPVVIVGMLIWANPEKRARFEAYFAKWTQSDDIAHIQERYQVRYAKIAVARGHWLGAGIGRSDVKYFLPASSTDFVFAIIIEEFGFAGGLILLLCYLFLILCSLSVIARESNEFLQLAGIGVVLFFTLNVLLHVGVNLDIVPTTGIPLPFVSQGGSALLVNLVSVGLILHMARKQSLDSSNR